MNNLLSPSWAVRFMVVAIGCVVILAGMRAIASILNPIFIAILFAVLFDIPRSWLIRRGMSTGLALTVTILGALLVTLIFSFPYRNYGSKSQRLLTRFSAAASNPTGGAWRNAGPSRHSGRRAQNAGAV